MPWITQMMFVGLNDIFHVRSLIVYCAIVQLKAVEKKNDEKDYMSRM